MQNLPEYELQKTPQESIAPVQQPSAVKPWMLVALIVTVGLVAYLAYLMIGVRPAAPVSVSVKAPAAPAATATAPPTTALGAEPMHVVLPPLDISDAFVRKLVAALSSHPRIVAWLTTDHLVRNFTAVVVNISEGKSPAVHLQRLRPAGRFQVVERPDDLRVDPRNYERYSRLAEAAASIDPGALARLYATLKPLIEQAYRDLGYVDAPFDRALERAIVLLVKTPVLEDPVALKPRSVGYVFADPRVESLTPAQKQLLRFGSRNVRMIQQALRQIGLALGIPAQRLV